MARILVIDDDAQVRLYLKQLLERNGYEVTEAPDGRQGIARFRSGGIDLVITDIIMPDKEGLETISDLRDIDPDVKIIAISGGGRRQPDDYLKMAESFGAARALPKPIDRAELLGTLKQLLAPA